MNNESTVTLKDNHLKKFKTLLTMGFEPTNWGVFGPEQFSSFVEIKQITNLIKNMVAPFCLQLEDDSALFQEVGLDVSS